MDSKKENIKNTAIVIGDWHFNSLGLVRSLGEKGVPVVFINMSESGYAESSRYTKKTYHASNRDEIVSIIAEEAKKTNGKPVLFPSSDKAALYIDSSLDRLGDICVVPGANGKLERLMDKTDMCEKAAAAGFTVPEAVTVELNDSGIKKMRGFGLPFLIKPLLSVEGSKADIFICRTESDIEKAIELFNSAESGYSRVLIQRFVDGKDNMMLEYCGCKVRGKRVHVFGQLEKIREYPVNRGSTSYAEIKDNITYIDVDALDSFLDKADYEGIFDLELKLVDGTAYFIEINYRNGAPSYAFTAGGFNIPYIWYCEKCGLPVTDCSGVNSTVLMCERDDLNHVKDRNISPFKWFGDIAKTDVMMLFNRSDPAPFDAAYGKPVRMILATIGRKLR